jgi:hypothetical protein
MGPFSFVGLSFIDLITTEKIFVSILWHADPLLRNDRERSSCIKSIAEQRLRKQTCFHSNNEMVFSVQSVPKCDKHDIQLS